MVSTKTIYKDYKAEIKDQIRAKTKEIHYISSYIVKLNQKIRKNADWFNQNTNIKANDLINNPDGFKHIVVNDVIVAYKGFDISLLQGLSKLYIQTFSKLQGLKMEKKKLKAKLMTFELFQDIMRIHNKLMLESMLKGKQVIFGTIGRFDIRKRKRGLGKGIRLVPDWIASNKVKANLIKQGITPKKENNNGEEWLVFRLEDGVWYHWVKKTSSATNKFYYRFCPTNYNNSQYDSEELKKVFEEDKMFKEPIGIVQILHCYRHQNPLKEIQYENNSNNGI